MAYLRTSGRRPASKCPLEAQGFEACGVTVRGYSGYELPCKAGLRYGQGRVLRLVYDVVLSRPEDYLSVYQSACNHSCLKCHSWYFTQAARGAWMSPDDLVEEALKYANEVTVKEPVDRATMWHASDLCAHCGWCVLKGEKGPYCPNKLGPEKIRLSPQGYGPARNIISFTGGDLYCQPAFYVETFKALKREVPELWIHIETNGYGLTPKNLELLYSAGLDSIWLDLKAFTEEVYRKLCGTSNRWVLKVPEAALDLGIVIEVVLIYIPGLVGLDEMAKFAEFLAGVRRDIPVMVLAFFPEHLMVGYREPTPDEIVAAYRVLKGAGLSRVKVGNVGVVCKERGCIDRLIRLLGREAVAL